MDVPPWSVCHTETTTMKEMVSRVWVVRAGTPILSEHFWRTYCEGRDGGALNLLVDLTLNFNGLGYWDTAQVLQDGGMPITDFVQRLDGAITRLENDGFPEFDDTVDADNWVYGHQEKKVRDACTCTPSDWNVTPVDCPFVRCPRVYLPDATLCSILHYHLRRLRAELMAFHPDDLVYEFNY